MFSFIVVFLLSVEFSLSMSIEVNEPFNNTEIRCYCNLPACITTSYMCKSRGLGCFSDIPAFADISKASHGCLDLLESERQNQCQNEPSKAPQTGDSSSLLLCCYRDLCNHVDNPETIQRYNDSFMASWTVVDRNVIVANPRLHPLPNYSNADVWMRAATIAVPVGAVIFFALIVLAIHMLQPDAVDDNMLASKLRPKSTGFSRIILPRPHLLQNLDQMDISNNPIVKSLPLVFHNESNRPLSSAPCLTRHPNCGQGVNVLHSCQQQHKNEANAKLNSTQNGGTDISVVVPITSLDTTRNIEPSNLIDLQKSSNPCNNNCNIYQQEECPDDLHSTCSLLTSAPATHHKLTYKKPLVISWTDADVKPTNSH